MGANPQRKIIHVDMDAFFASVEQRERPELQGRPVIVGGSPNSRGVVCTASYEARRFGVHSAMPLAHAYRLCPEGVYLPCNFEKYAEVSRQIRDIFRDYTALVEPLSLDEAFLDVTRNHRKEPSATRLAESIRRDILGSTRLTASAGVGPNKFIAKVASDINKPDGICVVPPDDVRSFLHDLPVRKIPGVGPALEARCRARDIQTCGHLLDHEELQLMSWFGQAGAWLFALARGDDERPVSPGRQRKSCGIEDTFPRDIHTQEQALGHLEQLAAGLQQRLARADVRGHCLTLKVKYADFTQITRSRTLNDPLGSASELMPVLRELVCQTEIGQRPIRLLGIALSQLESPKGTHQLLLPFYESLLQAEPEPREEPPTKP